MNNSQTQQSFDGLGIAPNFIKILSALHFVSTTPIQRRAIPIAIAGKDIIGIAQTGTGKTLAFGIPMIQRIAQSRGTGLVVLPTRELAVQVDAALRKIGLALGLRTSVLIGGEPQSRQLQSLRQDPHIIIATPGRLLDHMSQGTVKLNKVTILVLDEADRMLDMGFAPQIKKILHALPAERQIMLFSATMPPEIVRLGSAYMKLPLQIEIARPGTLAANISQELIIIRKEDKIRLLDTLLGRYTGRMLIFSRTKHGAKKICRSINAIGERAAELHSNRSLGQRRDALEGFKNNKYRVLVATDIAARGIDVQDIEVVINFDVPEDPEDYVHRIGRTGRAGRRGIAITFVAPDQRGKIRDIERLTKTTLAVKQQPTLAPARAIPATVHTLRQRPEYGRNSRRSPSIHNRRSGGARNRRRSYR